jgi:hypothetical protein
VLCEHTVRDPHHDSTHLGRCWRGSRGLAGLHRCKPLKPLLLHSRTCNGSSSCEAHVPGCTRLATPLPKTSRPHGALAGTHHSSHRCTHLANFVNALGRWDGCFCRRLGWLAGRRRCCARLGCLTGHHRHRTRLGQGASPCSCGLLGGRSPRAPPLRLICPRRISRLAGQAPLAQCLTLQSEAQGWSIHMSGQVRRPTTAAGCCWQAHNPHTVRHGTAHRLTLVPAASTWASGPRAPCSAERA